MITFNNYDRHPPIPAHENMMWKRKSTKEIKESDK